VINQLIKPLVFVAVVSLPVWVAVRVAINVSRKRRGKRLSIGRELILTSFFVYVIIVAAITVIPLRMSRFRNPEATDINIVPIVNNLKCLRSPNAAGAETLMFCLQNIVGNMLLFLPLGFALPLVSGKFAFVKRVAAFACALSLSIEAVQLLSRFARISYRSVDVDDVLLNTLGAVAGFALFVFVRHAFARKVSERVGT
jgi:glycopeptide antibiotics resistance protein